MKKEEIMHRFVRIVVAIAVIYPCIVSCGGPEKPGHPTIGQVFEDCATVDVGRTIPERATTILGWVLQVLQAGADGYEAELGKIGLSYGEDVLACAAKAARDMFVGRPVAATSTLTSTPTSPATSALSPATSALSPATSALSRADAFIARHGWLYK
jgi:hypothetical protein